MTRLAKLCAPLFMLAVLAGAGVAAGADPGGMIGASTLRKAEAGGAGLLGSSAIAQAGARKVRAKASNPGPVPSRDNGAAGTSLPFAGFSGASNDAPIHIESDNLALDYKAGTVLFQGHVHATQANVLLTSQSLLVTYGADFHEVKQMVANGNVKISQDTRWATGDHALLDQAKHTVVLTGHPVVHDGPNQVKGTKITVYLSSGKSVVESAHAVLFPHQAQTPDNNELDGHAKRAP